MFVILTELNGRHHAMAMCTRGEKRRRKIRQEEEAQRSTEVHFRAYRRPLVEVVEF